MLIYEVNLSVKGDAASRYSSWLREHVREMLDLDGFEAAAWYVRSDGESPPDPDEPTDPREWTIHYQVRNREALQAYLDEHAEEMRRDSEGRLGDDIEITRRVFEQKRLFHGRRKEDTGPV